MVSYLSVPQYGAGAGLYEIDETMGMKKLANHSGVFANRMLHHWTDSAIIGPYVIDAHGSFRTITDLLGTPMYTYVYPVYMYIHHIYT